MTSPAVLRRLASSQVHIQMIPTPNKLRESRQVLAALQKFGEITTFRNLKYDISNDSPNKHRPVIAIFESNDAAQRAIASSPLFVTLDSPSPSTSTSIPSSYTVTDTNKNKNTTEEPETNPKGSDPIFADAKPGTIKCIIEPSRHNHDSAMRRNPYFSSYYINEEDPVFKDMTSPQTDVPLNALGDTLQRRKDKVSPKAQNILRGKRRMMGAESLIDLWRDGLGGLDGKGDGEQGESR